MIQKTRFITADSATSHETSKDTSCGCFPVKSQRVYRLYRNAQRIGSFFALGPLERESGAILGLPQLAEERHKKSFSLCSHQYLLLSMLLKRIGGWPKKKPHTHTFRGTEWTFPIGGVLAVLQAACRSDTFAQKKRTRLGPPSCPLIALRGCGKVLWTRSPQQTILPLARVPIRSTHLQSRPGSARTVATMIPFFPPFLCASIYFDGDYLKLSWRKSWRRFQDVRFQTHG